MFLQFIPLISFFFFTLSFHAAELLPSSASSSIGLIQAKTRPISSDGLGLHFNFANAPLIRKKRILAEALLLASAGAAGAYLIPKGIKAYQKRRLKKKQKKRSRKIQPRKRIEEDSGDYDGDDDYSSADKDEADKQRQPSVSVEQQHVQHNHK